MQVYFKDGVEMVRDSSGTVISASCDYYLPQSREDQTSFCAVEGTHLSATHISPSRRLHGALDKLISAIPIILA